MSRLLTLSEAATQLGVKAGSLRAAAERHGFLVRMGRCLRVDPNDIPELLRKCRTPPQEDPACIASKTAAGSSATPAAATVQQALATAERLKRHSPATSRKGTGQPAQLRRIK